LGLGVTDASWREAVKAKGEGKREETSFSLWIPEGVECVKGLVVMSGHGSGEALFRHAQLRALARELRLGLFKFVGNPMQRGFWPRSLLDERLAAFGERCGQPELVRAPLFLYGHSNGTGHLRALSGCGRVARVGLGVDAAGHHVPVYQPGAARVPGW
jgi:hypothetical protein